MSVHRIRVITLTRNVGRLLWETESVAKGPLAAPFYAYSGKRGRAQLVVDGGPALSFPLGSDADFEIDVPPYRLCYRAEPPRADMPYGGYVLTMDSTRQGPIPLEVTFTSGMSIEPIFMSLDTRRTDPEDLSDLVARCATDEGRALASFGRIVEAETNSYPADTGRWSVDEVF